MKIIYLLSFTLKMKENFSLNEPLVRRPYLRYKLTADYKSRDVSGN